jgi:hypothetical protein
MKWLAEFLFRFLATHVAGKRPPNFIVGGDDPQGAYLRRWYLTPWRTWYSDVPEGERTRWQQFVHSWPSVYLHHFMRSDDDRALHDHPWAWASLLLHGAYIEHTIDAGGIHRRQLRNVGSLKVAGPRRAHRVELLGELTCWTLFVTGPRVRQWGFHCPDQGWIHFRRFTKPGSYGERGPGCEG